MKYKNLTIIGTSHIAKQSIEEVKSAFKEIKPGIVALELDEKRFAALRYKKKRKAGLRDILRIGLKGYLFSLIGGFVSRKLGKLVGVVPGSEMITAINLAKKNKTRVALIDQDIEITLKRFSRYFSWKEKFNFIADFFKGIFVREISFDLRKVPSEKVIERLIGKVKQRYPNVYKVLVYERNIIMARNLSKLMKEIPDKEILVIIGAGHEKDVLDLIKKPDISYSFSFNIG